MDIKLDTVGYIKEGQFSGWYIFITQYDDETFEILLSEKSNFDPNVNGADYFAEDQGSLETQLEYWKVKIDWTEK